MDFARILPIAVITPGIAALGPEAVARIVKTIAVLQGDAPPVEWVGRWWARCHA
jgi:hypothetical protein